MAQLVERLPSMQNIVGSNPAEATCDHAFFFALERRIGVVFRRSCFAWSCLVDCSIAYKLQTVARFMYMCISIIMHIPACRD